jgi:hypothetical protein
MPTPTSSQSKPPVFRALFFLFIVVLLVAGMLMGGRNDSIHERNEYMRSGIVASVERVEKACPEQTAQEYKKELAEMVQNEYHDDELKKKLKGVLPIAALLRRGRSGMSLQEEAYIEIRHLNGYTDAIVDQCFQAAARPR